MLYHAGRPVFILRNYGMFGMISKGSANEMTKS